MKEVCIILFYKLKYNVRKRVKYMNKLLLSLCFFMSGLSNAAITQIECPNIDNTKNFGPVRDQDGIGYCWAFAQAALVEEEVCISKGDKCDHKPISPIDISHCDFTLSDKNNQGNTLYAGLNCALTEGACFEELAPIPDAKNLKCRVSDFVGFGALCSSETLNTIYDNFKDKTKDLNVCQDIKIIDFTKNPFLETLNILSQLFPEKPYSRSSFEEILIKYSKKDKSNENKNKFLSDILIQNACRENRIKIKRSVKYENIDNKSTDSKVFDFARLLSRKRSLVAGICSHKYPVFKHLLSNPEESCGGHAVVINGMRWNSELNKCEVHIRNSWGENSLISGWSDANTTAYMTHGVSYFK